MDEERDLVVEYVNDYGAWAWAYDGWVASSNDYYVDDYDNFKEYMEGVIGVYIYDHGNEYGAKRGLKYIKIPTEQQLSYIYHWLHDEDISTKQTAICDFETACLGE